MASTSTYFVFRRNPDGYVSAIASQRRSLAEMRLRPYNSPSGVAWSFDILLETTDWSQARERITRERIAVERAASAATPAGEVWPDGCTCGGVIGAYCPLCNPTAEDLGHCAGCAAPNVAGADNCRDGKHRWGREG